MADVRTCDQCGATISPHPNAGRPKRWCGDECRRAFQREHRRTSRTLTCRTCGDSMYAGTGSLPQGEAECRPCRRKRAEPEPPPQFSEQRRCRKCRRVFEARRSTQVYCTPACRPNRTAPKAPAEARGYGSAHRRERKKWKPRVEAGEIDCARCGIRIQPGEPWDLGHTDDRTGYIGPEHRHCNRADGARKRHESGPSVTGHLRWEWRQCVDCGVKCYGERCAICRRALGKGKTSRVLFTTCSWCATLFTARSAAQRYCNKDCARAAQREASNATRRASYVPTPRQPKSVPTHFTCGHERTEANTYFVRSKNWHQCRTCRRARKAIQKRAARLRLALTPGVPPIA